MNRYATLITVLLLTLFLASCTDSTLLEGDTENGTPSEAPDNGPTGGGAGDEENADAINLIRPLVGSYQLPTNWSGLPGSEAYLQIQEPNVSGEAEAILFRASLSENCINPNISSAEVVKDPVGPRVFLNRLFELPNSVLSRSGNNLVIDIARDVQDVDGDGNESEPARLLAPFISDLPEICQ